MSAHVLNELGKRDKTPLEYLQFFYIILSQIL